MRPDGFQLIAAAIGDETLYSDGLRIIAKDQRGMSDADRKMLVDAAECLEQVSPTFLRLSAELTETRAQLQAAQERIAALTPKPTALPFSMGLSITARSVIRPGFEGLK